MPKPKEEIDFLINTIEDMMWNDHINEFFLYLETLSKDGYTLCFYRKGHDEALTKIRDINHLENFKYSFKFLNII